MTVSSFSLREQRPFSALVAPERQLFSQAEGLYDPNNFSLSQSCQSLALIDSLKFFPSLSFLQVRLTAANALKTDILSKLITMTSLLFLSL